MLENSTKNIGESTKNFVLPKPIEKEIVNFREENSETVEKEKCSKSRWLEPN